MALKEYWRKRDFEKTGEPKGGAVAKTNGHRFVIQKHAASRLHYDLRLELDGTLKSWAVPKGVPYAKGEKRLAIQVEDHPVSYIDFEGTIPQGQYGGGTVMVWDRGTFEALSQSPRKDLAAGKLHFVLAGKKLQGEWYLVRLRDHKQWLLIRGKSDLRAVSRKLDDVSALSGRTMKELAAGSEVWHTAPSITQAPKDSAAKNKRPRSLGIKFVAPMKARLVTVPPAGDWSYEIKLDGFRAIALKQGKQVRLLSRNEKDLGEKFAEVVDGIGRLRTEEAILDGEIVALDSKGRSSFPLLQARELGKERPPIFFYAFDLLQWNGNNLLKAPLLARKARLERLLKNSPDAIRFSSSLGGNAPKLLQQARRLGLEGLIGKRNDSVYEPGKRSGSWIKLKLLQQQEFVIGGYTEPEGSRQYFGALLVGYQAKEGLRFSGKVGTGFTEAMIQTLHARLTRLGTPRCPFANLAERKARRSTQGMTAAEMKRCHWVKPSLVCQVKFAEWTQEGKLRQPVFLGLREDTNANAVIRETPA